ASLLLVSCRVDVPLLSCFVHWAAASRALPSFPTRRSSDLVARRAGDPIRHPCELATGPSETPLRRRCPCACARKHMDSGAGAERSEEHTSELQSRGQLVCRLLLEKKKKTTQT